jgi:hypothetical protein
MINKEYSLYLTRSYPQRVFWGDRHLHISYSTDAGMKWRKVECTRVSSREKGAEKFHLKPREVYNARVISTGYLLRLRYDD